METHNPPPMSNTPIIAGTLQTDPRSGGVKRKSGVNVLPIVSEGKGFLIVGLPCWPIAIVLTFVTVRIVVDGKWTCRVFFLFP